MRSSSVLHIGQRLDIAVREPGAGCGKIDSRKRDEWRADLLWSIRRVLRQWTRMSNMVFARVIPSWMPLYVREVSYHLTRRKLCAPGRTLSRVLMQFNDFCKRGTNEEGERAIHKRRSSFLISWCRGISEHVSAGGVAATRLASVNIAGFLIAASRLLLMNFFLYPVFSATI